MINAVTLIEVMWVEARWLIVFKKQYLRLIKKQFKL